MEALPRWIASELRKALERGKEIASVRIDADVRNHAGPEREVAQHPAIEARDFERGMLNVGGQLTDAVFVSRNPKTTAVELVPIDGSEPKSSRPSAEIHEYPKELDARPGTRVGVEVEPVEMHSLGRFRRASLCSFEEGEGQIDASAMRHRLGDLLVDLPL